jgi:phosphohistidine phosphatase
MILYFVRHAIAVPQGSAGAADVERELTREGIDKMKRAATGLRAAEAIPDIILSSPLVRARQTAEILMEAFDGKPVLTVVQALAPGGNRSELYLEIRKHADARALMLVGHQPSLGEIAGEIVWGTPSHPLDLKKGGACAMEVDKVAPAPRGTLLWIMPPAILRKLC